MARRLLWGAAMSVVAPLDLAREVVARQLPVLEAQLDQQGRSLRWWQRRSLEKVAGCSDPEGGFALLRCADCHRSRVVAFTCGVRGVCSTCAGRVMSSRAARWVDRLFPLGVAVRQWVLTVPWPRRFLLARHPALCKEVLATALQVVFGWYGRRGETLTGLPGHTGSVTVIQRFSSSLRLNLHFHALVLDGACVEEADGTVRWQRVGPPSTEDVAELVADIASRVEALLARRGYPADDPDAGFDEVDDTSELLDAAVAGRVALGLRAGHRTRSLRRLPERPWQLPPRSAQVDGYNLHAAVVVQDRDALERLCRYVNRPVLAKGRLTQREDGLLQLTLRRPWANGTTSFLFSELEFTERLVALLPPPNANQVLYHGVLAPRATLRARVVPTPAAPELSRGALRCHGPASKSDRWTRWADLLFRVFGRDGFACECGGTLVLHAVVLPPATTDVLTSLRRSARGPPAPAGRVRTPDPLMLLAPAHLPPPPTPAS